MYVEELKFFMIIVFLTYMFLSKRGKKDEPWFILCALWLNDLCKVFQSVETNSALSFTTHGQIPSRNNIQIFHHFSLKMVTLIMC